MKNLLLAVFLLVSYSYAQEYKWYKGNIHTHTNRSDGDEYPRKVVNWYKEHDYNFLVLSDHDMLTETKYIDSDKEDDFLLIPGEEVSCNFEKRPIHINGINIKKLVLPQHGKTAGEVVQNNVDAIHEAGGISMLNHPMWRRSLSAKDVINLKGCELLEIFNLAETNTFAAGGSPSMEMFWDSLLSNNIVIYGTATDDAHNFVGEFSSRKSNPGRGWLSVRSTEFTADAITAAIKRGDFYASSGLVIKDITITDKEYKLVIATNPILNYSTFFIGKDGKILKEDYSPTPSYEFKGDELYVRAKVFCSNGVYAITQPKFLKRK
jgi:hypothetical protein